MKRFREQQGAGLTRVMGDRELSLSLLRAWQQLVERKQATPSALKGVVGKLRECVSGAARILLG